MYFFIYSHLYTCVAKHVHTHTYIYKYIYLFIYIYMGFPGGSMGKESTCLVRDAGGTGLIPGQKDPLEKGMAIYSGILNWRIPWTKKPGGLQSIELQKSWPWLK